jgi:hypothetical protein
VHSGSGSGLSLLRGTALAVLSALLTAVGHLAGGGAVPDLALLLVLFPLLTGVLVALADRCSGAAGTVATLAAGQLALHHLLVLMHPSHEVAGTAVFDGTGMLAMHAGATLATAVMVGHADRALVALVAALRRVVPRRLAIAPVHRPLPTLAVPGPAVPARLARALAAPLVRRGPPVGC